MDLKLQFINQALAEYGIDVQEAIIREARRLDVEDTGGLINSVRYQVLQATAEHEGAAEIIFQEHGRFLDMGKGRISTSESRRNSRIKRRRRRPRKIYSPVAFGLLNPLIGKLAYGFTQATIDQLKHSLTN